jgi:hypothetical protein
VSERSASPLRGVAGLAIAASGIALALVATHQLVAIDLWWQLAAGEWIAEHGLPTVDPFSFGHPGRPWIEQRWLFFVAEHAIASHAGLNALIAAKLVWLAGCFALLERAMRPAPRWARALGLAVAVALLHSRLKVRPELVTYLGVIGFLLVFEQHRRSGSDRWLWALPVLQLVWSNGHTLWIVGPALAWIAWALEAGLARWPGLAEGVRVVPALPAPRRRALLRAAAAVSIASLVTPYLFLGQLYPTTILEQIGVGSKLREVIVELQSPFSMRDDPIFFGSYALAVALSFACMLLPVRAPALRIAVWAGFVGFSFLAARNVSLLGPVAGWVIAQQLGDWSQAAGAKRPVVVRRIARLATALALLGALSLSLGALTDRLWRGRGWNQRFGTGVREALYPIEAMAFVDQHGLPRPVLSGLGDASYLIREGGPRSVFIDGRLEVYGADLILENANQWSTAEGVIADADRHGVDSVLLPYPLMSDAIRGFEASGDWAPVYYDSARVLYLRRASAARVRLSALELDWTGDGQGGVAARPRPRAAVPAALSPPDWAEGWAPRVVDSAEPFGRAMLLLHVGATSAGEQALHEVVAGEPGHVEARLNLGLLAELAGDAAAAREHFSRVAAVRREALDVHEARVALARRQGDGARGFAAAVAALEAGSRARIVLATLVEHAAAPARAETARRALRAALEAADSTASPDADTLRAALRAVDQRSTRSGH